MGVKTSWMASWDAILCPPWVEWKKWIPMGSNN
jgi:hypothetical protein